MSPPMEQDEEEAIYNLYYREGYVVGRDKLYRELQRRGYNISVRQVRDWLRRQYIAQLYYPPRRIKRIRTTITHLPGSQLGVDLADLQNEAYKGYKYILTAIDLLTKYAFAVPLKTKKGSVVAEGMSKILTEAKRLGMKVLSFRSDRGSEFKSKEVRELLQKRSITQVFSTAGNPQSNGQVERLNGIIKRWLRMRMKANQTKDWVSMLEETLNVYNTTLQETIGMSPEEALQDEPRNVRQRLEEKVKRKPKSPKLNIGDRVRVLIRFTKETEKPKDGILWSPDVYEIVKVNKAKKPWVSTTYRLKDVKGNFYAEELQLIEGVENERNDPKMWDISKIIRPSTQDGEPGYIVAWKGYRKKSENTWEPRANLIEDIAKALELFEKRNDVKWFQTSQGWRFTWNGKAD